MLLPQLLVYGSFLVPQVSARSTGYARRLEPGHHKRSLPLGAIYNYTWTDDISDDIYETTARPADWMEFAQKGRKYWNAWKEKSGADIDPPATVYEVMKIKYRNNPTIDATTQGLLRSMGRSYDGTDYTVIDAWWSNPNGAPPKKADGYPEGSAHFKCEVSAKEDTLIVTDTHRGKLSKDWHSSQVLWWIWQEAMLRHASIDDVNQLDYSGLGYIFRQHVINTESLPILKYAVFLKRGLPDQSLIFRPSDETEPDLANNPIWAILGTPNGASVINMLTDNKEAMKGKGIKMLAVEWYKDPDKNDKEVDVFTWWVDLDSANHDLGDRFSPDDELGSDDPDDSDDQDDGECSDDGEYGDEDH